MRRPKLKLAGLILVCLLPGMSACMSTAEKGTGGSEEKKFTLSWQDAEKEVRLTAAELEQWGGREIPSAYFDWVMDYKNSRFVSVAFKEILARYPARGADAVLLNCFDDYQGLLSIADILKLNLEVATRINLAPGADKPGWLNPLLILVPDGSDAPYQERFMTANIREIRFVSLKQYYAPLDGIAKKFPQAAEGLTVFKDNCVYCHSIRQVGGSKGGLLLDKFDFKLTRTREEFKNRFVAFHRDNPDKQNIEQFVGPAQLEAVTAFLEKADSVQ